MTHASLREYFDAARSALDPDQASGLERAYEDCRADQTHRIPDEDGFLLTAMKDAATLESAIDHCRRNWPKEHIERTVSKPSKKDTMLSVHMDFHDLRNEPIRELVLAPEVVATAANYLGTVPVLCGTYVWYCPNRETDRLIGSQLFHCDRQDYRQVKIFIPIDEIRADSGPTTCVSAAATKRFFEHRRDSGQSVSIKARFSDDEVHRYGSEEEHPVIGSAGTLGFIDTINCLHYGSRPARQSKYHMVVQFYTPFSPRVEKEIDPAVFQQGARQIVLSYRDTSDSIQEPTA